MSLIITPISFRDANAYVKANHRHHKPVVGMKFCVAVTWWDAQAQSACESPIDKIVGVAIVGRPVARMSDNGYTLEVNRLCTDGTKNAASKLKGAICRVGFGLGYRRIITYTLPSEGGGSMRAAGWRLIGERGGGNWNVPSRPRIDTAHELRGQKLLWELTP